MRQGKWHAGLVLVGVRVEMHMGGVCVCVRAAAGVRVGRSYLIGAWRAPTQLRGTSGPLKGERDLRRLQGLPEARTGPA